LFRPLPRLQGQVAQFIYGFDAIAQILSIKKARFFTVPLFLF